MNDTKGFDADSFYKSLAITVSVKQKNWRQVSEETGVGASTLTRMSRGSMPDAASLAALCAWSGINPSDFVTSKFKQNSAEPLSQISRLLRSDPNLNKKSAESLESIIKTAYENLKNA